MPYGGIGGKTEEVVGGVGGKIGTEDAEEGMFMAGGVGAVAEPFFVFGLIELTWTVTVPLTSDVGVIVGENKVVNGLVTFPAETLGVWLGVENFKKGVDFICSVVE